MGLLNVQDFSLNYKLNIKGIEEGTLNQDLSKLIKKSNHLLSTIIHSNEEGSTYPPIVQEPEILALHALPITVSFLSY